MRNFIILTILAIVFFATGWTIYRFVANRAEDVASNTNSAPALQQAPTATPSAKPTAVAPAVRITPTPTPKTTAVSTGSKPQPAANAIPTTGPGMLSLGMVGLLIIGGGTGTQMVLRRRSLKKAYNTKNIL